MSYLKKNFLLKNKSAEKLYFDYAEKMPIFDYHCHLPEKEILENKPFNDIFEVWMGKDHYKWRLMRNFGINEEYITGNASNKDKFVAYCKTIGSAFGNPLYHWSQVELKDFFDCEYTINEENALKIWDHCNDYIKKNNVTPQKLIEKSNVKYIFTTNEIFDDLSTFTKIKEKGYSFEVYPAFRADKIMGIEAPNYLDIIKKVEACSNKINNFNDLLIAIEKRLNDFIKVGSKAADISVLFVYPVSSFEQAENVFNKVLKGEKINENESEIFKGFLTYYLMSLYGKFDIRTELHLGATRNNNTVMFNKLGADSGFDAIGEEDSIKNMGLLFDKLNVESKLPKTIVFNLNQKMNPAIMPLLGSFQDDSAKGKMQYGPAWWFLDNKQGMEKHLSDLTATGHLATFVGMLTDSRSFLSYPRHHYFRRILCNYLGQMIEDGEITDDIGFVGNVVKDISYNNSVDYFGLKR